MDVYLDSILNISTELNYADISPNYQVHKIQVKSGEHLIRAVVNDTILKEIKVDFNLKKNIFIFLSSNLALIENEFYKERGIDSMNFVIESDYDLKIVTSNGERDKVW